MKTITRMNKTELKNELTSRGINFDDSAKKPELLALLQNAIEPEKADEPKAEESSETKVDSKKPVAYDMRKALVSAHNDGNKHAITAAEASNLGITKPQYDYWVNRVGDYYKAVQKFADLARTKDSDSKELAELYNALFPIWKSLLIVGEEDKFHPNLWVSEEDVKFHVGYVSKFVVTSKGKVDGNVTPETFRKCIETQIGIKIANNGVMSNDDRDTIESYYASKKSKESATRRLKGYDSKNGHVNGVVDEIKNLKKKIEDDTNNLLAVGVPVETIKKFLSGAETRLKELKNTQSQLNKTISNADENMNKLFTNVQAIEEKLESATV